MYDTIYHINTPEGNNAFSYHERLTQKHQATITVPSLIEGIMSDVTEGIHIVLEEVDEHGALQSCRGLTHHVLLKHPTTGSPVYVMDNHNHAFAYWCRELQKGRVTTSATLYHVDQHKDMRSPEVFLTNEQLFDAQKVYHYVQHDLNVGNFIQPALQAGLLQEVVFFDKQQDFLDSTNMQQNAIVDIDLDIFAEELSYLDFENVLTTCRELMLGASVITIATSPFFISQQRALQFLELLFHQSNE